MIFSDIIKPFSDRADWEAFSKQHRFVTEPLYIRWIVSHAQQFGVTSDFLGRVPPDQVKIDGLNYREQLIANGLNSRQRAVLELVAAHPGLAGVHSATTYAAAD